MKELTLEDLGLTKQQIEILVKGARLAFGETLPDPLQPPEQESNLSYAEATGKKT